MMYVEVWLQALPVFVAVLHWHVFWLYLKLVIFHKFERKLWYVSAFVLRGRPQGHPSGCFSAMGRKHVPCVSKRNA